MGDLLRAALYGMVRLHTGQVSCTNRPSDTPRAHPLVAYQASLGPVVVNAHHQMVRLEPLGLEVVKLADGTRSRGEILETLIERANCGQIAVASDASAVGGDEAVRLILARELERTFTTLTGNALLVE